MANKEERSFEENLKRIEEIVTALEEGNISLENSINLFEEGMELTKDCNEKLESIENRINILVNDNGKIKSEKFDINGVEEDGI
ncbi:MAG TPA: exodeoxyribonuclease VII small subunit [Eubacteriaceae bacterium]|jgi:exodeoxyribonuclease VII small subunit|nr:exodeoxyribonuclease VII small subunit [Eubacteriaceae bacterium]